jgi:hypothetical protein
MSCFLAKAGVDDEAPVVSIMALTGLPRPGLGEIGD